MEVVSQIGDKLENGSVELKKEEDIVVEAVKEIEDTLRNASDDLKNNVDCIIVKRPLWDLLATFVWNSFDIAEPLQSNHIFA